MPKHFKLLPNISVAMRALQAPPIMLLMVLMCHAITTMTASRVSASDFQSPRTQALGGAGHAGPMLNDALYLNPSFVSFLQVHSLSLNYLSYSGATTQSSLGPIDYYGHDLNASVIDGTSESIFQAGVAYTIRGDSRIIHVGASKNTTQETGVGIGGKFIFPRREGSERLHEATASFTALIAPWIQSSFTIDNIFESAVDDGFQREVILGTKFNLMSIFFIYLDPHWFPSLPEGQKKWGYEAGLEFPFFQDFYLRMGLYNNSTVSYQNQRGDGYGVGGGWLAPRMSLDYSFSRVLSHAIQSHAHTFGMSIYF